MKDAVKNLLKNIPQGRLVRLIGSDVCTAISDYTSLFQGQAVDYKEVLVSRFGEAFLLARPVYDTVMQWVDPSLAASICASLGIEYNTADDAVNALQGIDLSRKSADFVADFARACGLAPENYAEKDAASDAQAFSNLQAVAALHPFQKRLKDRIVKEILGVEQNVALLAHMPTGSGKTRTCMEALVDFHRAKAALGGHDFGGFIVWLAHSKELCEQACETFEFLWARRGDSSLPVVRLYGDFEYTDDLLDVDNAMIFASFQKLNAMRRPSVGELQRRLSGRMATKTRLVVVDEAHRSLATTYEDAVGFLRSSPGTRLIGLTATPGRTADLSAPENEYLSCFYQGLRIGMESEFGQPLEDPVKYLQEKEILAIIEREELHTHCEIDISSEDDLQSLKRDGDDFLGSVSDRLANDPSRNHMLVMEISKAHERGDAILVFTCSVSHCVILETLLRKVGVEAESVLGSTGKGEREDRIERFRAKELRVLLNYGVLSTGFDAPCLNTLIIARPISSVILYSQMVGRALRGPLNGGNARNRVIDLIDNIRVMGTVSRQFSHFDKIWN